MGSPSVREKFRFDLHDDISLRSPTVDGTPRNFDINSSPEVMVAALVQVIIFFLCVCVCVYAIN
jgi:hypothetical protein